MDVLRLTGRPAKTSRLSYLQHCNDRLFDVYAEIHEDWSDSPQSKVVVGVILAWFYFQVLMLAIMPKANYLGSSFALDLSQDLNVLNFAAYSDYLELALLAYAAILNITFILRKYLQTVSRS
jgi:hypothetical protein